MSRERETSDEGEGEETDVAAEEVLDVEQEATPLRKRKADAPVWQHGGIKVDGGSKCALCGKVYKTDINNTTNLTGHILAKHKNTEEARLLKAEVEEKKRKSEAAKDELDKKKKEKQQFSQSRITTFAKKTIPIDPVKKKQVDQALVEYLVVENRSFETVEKEAFRKLMHSANPDYKCSSRRTVTRMFDETAGKVKKSLKEEIRDDLAGVDVKAIHITSQGCKKSNLVKTVSNLCNLGITSLHFNWFFG